MHNYKSSKATTRIGNSKAKQKIQRFKAKLAQGKNPSKPHIKHSPAPKLPPLPPHIKLGNYTKVLLGYAQQIWHNQSNSYVNTHLTITAYILHTHNNGLHTCYVPRLRTKPAYIVTAHSNPYTQPFIAGLQQFYLIRVLRPALT